jgi:PAS domain S-box-containing protein
MHQSSKIKILSLIILQLLLLLNLFPQEKTKQIEAKLSQVQGKEKIPLLMKLTENYRFSDSKKSLEYGQQALTLLKTFPNQNQETEVFISMSEASKELSKFKDAENFANKAIELAKENDARLLLANAKMALGAATVYLSKVENALEVFNEALDIYIALNALKGIAKASLLMGNTYHLLRDFPNALKYYLSSLRAYEELNEIGWITIAHNNIGVVYLELKEFKKSEVHYRESLDISTRIKDPEGVALALNNIGLIMKEQERYAEALEYMQRSMKILEELGRKRFLSDILNNTGEIYIHLDKLNLALQYFDRSSKIKEELGDRKGLSRLLINSASINRRMGKLDIAISQALRALKLSREFNVKAEINDTYKELSKTYEAMEDHKKALEYYKIYTELQTSIFNQENSDKIAELQVLHEKDKKEKEIVLLKKEQDNDRMVRYFLILIIATIFLLAFVIFTRYRLKARTTRQLEKEIEERKRTEEKLRESEGKFRVLAERSVVGIWIIQDNLVKYANPRLSKIFGRELDEMIERNPLELVQEEDRPLVTHHLQNRSSGAENTIAYEFKGNTKKGELINLESYGSSTHYQGKPAVLETIIDITDRKKVEQELLKSRKLQSVGILAGGIAHDFNNLLTVIIGNVTMTKMSLKESNVKPQCYALLDKAEKASFQATDLAQKFITFSEGGWVSPRKVTLSILLKNTIHLYHDLEKIHCNISIPQDLNPLYGDERQLREVFINLLLNARDAIDDSRKEVTIEAENITLLTTNEFLLKGGEYVKVSVRDKGKGIPAHQIENIFDPYFSTKNHVSRKGLGLGLAICYSIIKKHEGHIDVDSIEGRGTTVNLYLPAFRREMA